jgi:starch synthase (maltosyl-transferring)
VTPEVHAVLERHPLRDLVTSSPEHPLLVQRERALFCAWYELFPRSQGAHVDQDGRWVSGTLRTAAERLPAVAAMGFDVVYLPPIHPIGRVNRKGRNNTLDPSPNDPGSTWAVGAKEGGHDAIHPDLGRSRTSTPSSTPPGPRDWRSRSTWPCSAHPTTPGR